MASRIEGIEQAIARLADAQEARPLASDKPANEPDDYSGKLLEIESKLSTLTEAIADLTAKEDAPDIGPKLTELTASIASVAQRPDPVLDLTEQRQSFAKFGTVLAQVVQRLESVAGKFDTDQLEPVTRALSDFSIQSELRNEALAKDLADVRSKIEASNASLTDMATLAKTAEDTSSLGPMIAVLEEKIDFVSQRPDPVLDLTEQRRSLAQFNAAAGTFLRRLECLVATMASDFAQLEQKITLHLPAAGEESDSSEPHDPDLADAIKHLAIANKTLADSSLPSPETAQLLLDVRTTFAEFLADFSRRMEHGEAAR